MKGEYNKKYNNKPRNYFEKHKQGNDVIDKQNKSGSSETQTNENKKPTKWCNYCRKNGQTRERCYSLKNMNQSTKITNLYQLVLCTMVVHVINTNSENINPLWTRKSV